MYDDKIKDYQDLKKAIHFMRKKRNSLNTSSAKVISTNATSDGSKAQARSSSSHYFSDFNLSSVFVCIRNLLLTETVLFGTTKFVFKALSKRPGLILRGFSVATVIFGFIKIRNWWRQESYNSIQKSPSKKHLDQTSF